MTQIREIIDQSVIPLFKAKVAGREKRPRNRLGPISEEEEDNLTMSDETFDDLLAELEDSSRDRDNGSYSGILSDTGIPESR